MMRMEVSAFRVWVSKLFGNTSHTSHIAAVYNCAVFRTKNHLLKMEFEHANDLPYSNKLFSVQ